jgi:hypothetical protein
VTSGYDYESWFSPFLIHKFAAATPPRIAATVAKHRPGAIFLLVAQLPFCEISFPVPQINAR